MVHNRAISDLAPNRYSYILVCHLGVTFMLYLIIDRFRVTHCGSCSSAYARSYSQTFCYVALGQSFPQSRSDLVASLIGRSHILTGMFDMYYPSHDQCILYYHPKRARRSAVTLRYIYFGKLVAFVEDASAVSSLTLLCVCQCI
jgi:hypothetical protein